MPDSLRLYLDQMFHIRVANALRAEGYDVLRAFEAGQAISDDEEILQKAITYNRILVTLDEHFGDWTILPLCHHYGVIRVKVNPTTTDNIVRILVPFLKKHNYEDFKNHLVI